LNECEREVRSLEMRLLKPDARRQGVDGWLVVCAACSTGQGCRWLLLLWRACRAWLAV
jgi:hypothetical protein